MAWLSPSFVALVAIVENVLIIHTPLSDVRSMNIQITTDSYFNELWLPLYNRNVERTPTFQTVLPTSQDKYYHYKLQVEFRNKSILMSADWITIGMGVKHKIPVGEDETIENKSSTREDSQDFKDNQHLIYISIIIMAVTLTILLSKMIYNIGKSQCTLWFNK